MFIHLSNMTFNNSMFTSEKLGAMHETMKRLMAEAKRLRGINTQTELANLLNESPQRVNNWSRRGVSVDGAVSAEKAFGCSPAFVLNGIESILGFSESATITEKVSEPTKFYMTNPPWPFKNISPVEFSRLTLDQINDVEQLVKSMISRHSNKNAEKNAA